MNTNLRVPLQEIIFPISNSDTNQWTVLAKALQRDRNNRMYISLSLGASQAAQWVENLPANAGDTGDLGLIPGSGRSPGGGHGHPLQYSCLENPMDRGAWSLQSIGSQRVRHNWSDWVCTHASLPSCLSVSLSRDWLKVIGLHAEVKNPEGKPGRLENWEVLMILSWRTVWR